MFVAALVLAAGVGSAGALHAGWKATTTDWEVKFGTSGSMKTFEGYMGSARASADSTQYIGCEVEWYGPTSSNTATVHPSNVGWCWASDKNGNTRSCYLTIRDNTATSAIGNVIQDSYIYAAYFTLDGVPYCNAVNIYNYSYDPLKK